MAVADLIVADFSPVAGSVPTSFTAHSIGFGTHWFAAASGASVASPSRPAAIGNSSDDMRPVPPSEVDEPWARHLEGKVSYVTRIMTGKPRGLRLVETARGPNDVTDLWWCEGSEVRLARASLARTSAVELLADGVGILLDRDNGQLERFHADSPMAHVIALPAIVEPAAHRGLSRLFAALRTADALVIAGDKRCYWMRIGQLLGDLGSSITWNITWTFPGADPDARREGTVTMCKYGVTNVEFPDGKKQFSGDFQVGVGDKIALVGKLWERLGAVQYREIERPDGTRMPMPGAPNLVPQQTSKVTTREISVEPPKRALPAKLLAQVAALREVGVLDEMTDAVLAEYCEGIEAPDIVETILHYYVHDRSRAARDRYLAHDWRFGQETDDVIAELSALLGSPPLFTQLANGRDGIRVRGPFGDELLDCEDGLQGIVDHFNHALNQGTAFGDVRIYALRTHDERHAYYALSKDALTRLKRAGIPIGS